jgi:hypothetical protein
MIWITEISHIAQPVIRPAQKGMHLYGNIPQDHAVYHACDHIGSLLGCLVCEIKGQKQYKIAQGPIVTASGKNHQYKHYHPHKKQWVIKFGAMFLHKKADGGVNHAVSHKKNAKGDNNSIRKQKIQTPRNDCGNENHSCHKPQGRPHKIRNLILCEITPSVVCKQKHSHKNSQGISAEFNHAAVPRIALNLLCVNAYCQKTDRNKYILNIDIREYSFNDFHLKWSPYQGQYPAGISRNCFHLTATPTALSREKACGNQIPGVETSFQPKWFSKNNEK